MRTIIILGLAAIALTGGTTMLVDETTRTATIAKVQQAICHGDNVMDNGLIQTVQEGEWCTHGTTGGTETKAEPVITTDDSDMTEAGPAPAETEAVTRPKPRLDYATVRQIAYGLCMCGAHNAPSNRQCLADTFQQWGHTGIQADNPAIAELLGRRPTARICNQMNGA